MPDSISLREFFDSRGPSFDVRSPGEFLQGHIPGTINLPLMNNEERALVGTAYKQHGQEFAIELGLELLGPQLLDLFKKAKRHINLEKTVQDDFVKVLCWRGGMRSGFVARLLESFGYKTATLKGGYKTFRRWALKIFDSFDAQDFPKFYVLGGLTGSGKTAILQLLRDRGEQVIDLEGLACHRGSSFGMLGMPQQPSTEHFHNQIALLWNTFDLTRPIWIEDESRTIGHCHLPDPLYRQIISSPLFIMQRPVEERLDNLLVDYGQVPRERLMESTLKISKRLGGQRVIEIMTLLKDGEMKEAFRLILAYYDAAYEHGLARRNQSKIILVDAGLSTSEWASLLQNQSKLDYP